MYYPIIQSISRSGYAWYESQYGFDFRVSEAEHDPERYTALMYAAIITPTVSLAYLILFLTIEPNAYIIFKEIFCGIKVSSDDNNKQNVTLDDDNELNEEVRETQSERIYNSANESFFSWDNFRSSVANIFTVSIDYDNRTESEIFAIIDESHFIQKSTIKTIELNHSNNSNNNNNNNNNGNASTTTINIIHNTHVENKIESS